LPLLAGLTPEQFGSGVSDFQQTWSEENDSSTTPTLYQDLLFVITGDGLLVALNLETDVRVWERSLGGFPYDDALAIIDGTLLAGSSTGRLVAIEPTTGKVQWQRTLSHPVIGFAEDGANIIVSSTGGLHSVALTDGQVVWETELNPYRYGTSFDYVFGAVPTVVGNGAFIRTESGVIALSTSNGQLLWDQSVPKNSRDLIHGGNLAVAGETLFAVSDVLRAIDIRTGDVSWTIEEEAADRSHYYRGFVSPVTDGTSVYTGIETIQSFDTESGATNWTGGGYPAFLNPLSYDPETTTLYMSTVSESNMLVVGMNPDAGTELWQAVVGETRSGYALSRSEISRPIPHAGSIYVACRGTSIALSEREVSFSTSTTSTPARVNEDSETSQPENQVSRTQDPESEDNLDRPTEEYRGLISNNPQSDIVTQGGSFYTLTLVSTVLSLIMLVGQLLRRERE
jgi:outer membrane protein assembly factor BamB